MFDSKRAASIIRSHLLRQLHELQLRILMVERFGPHVVTHPEIQTRPGSTESLDSLQRRHDEYVAMVERLTTAIDTATAIEWEQIIADVKRRNL